jgi:hypothetical protein
MKTILVLGCLALCAPLAHAGVTRGTPPAQAAAEEPSKDIIVDGIALLIPAPPGFVPVTSDMEPYTSALENLGNDANIQVCGFLTEADAAIVRQGKMPVHEHRAYVQRLGLLTDQDTSLTEFSELKRYTISMFEAVMTKYGGKLSDVDKPLRHPRPDADILTAKPRPEVTNFFAFPLHYETENAMAVSLWKKLSVSGVNYQQLEFDQVVTYTVLLVKGKVLLLFVTGDKADLQWTRTTARKWAAKVIAANLK